MKATWRAPSRRSREVVEAVERPLAIERRAADQRAQRPQRLEVVGRVELDERVGLLGGGRALRVDDDERPRRAIEAQPLQQARVGDGRVRAPDDDELGPVADLAERRRARADRRVGATARRRAAGSTTAPIASASATARRCASQLVWPRP